jgi:hypothetical protein
MMASLVVAGVLLLAMIAASGRGAVALPADARIPVHCGSAEHCFLVSKRAGLLIWPAVGAVLFGALGGITRSGLAAGWVPGVRDVLVPAALCVVLGFQVGALILAGRGPARRGPARRGPAGRRPAGRGPAGP